MRQPPAPHLRPLSPGSALLLLRDPVPGQLPHQGLRGPTSPTPPRLLPCSRVGAHSGRRAAPSTFPARPGSLRGRRSWRQAVGGCVGGRWCFPSPGWFLPPPQHCPCTVRAEWWVLAACGLWGTQGDRVGALAAPRPQPQHRAALGRAPTHGCLGGKVSRWAGGDGLPRGQLAQHGQGGTGMAMLCLSGVGY